MGSIYFFGRDKCYRPVIYYNVNRLKDIMADP
jgi:hypothetical protein